MKYKVRKNRKHEPQEKLEVGSGVKEKASPVDRSHQLYAPFNTQNSMQLETVRLDHGKATTYSQNQHV
jgi:hypothetical protein